MQAEPFQVLRAQRKAAATPRGAGRLMIVGAGGALGNEVLRRLVGSRQFEDTQVLAREPITAGLRGVTARVVAGDAPELWPPAAADTAIVMFDPPRMYHQRERALWTPRPEQLPALAQWLRRSGATTLAVVLPHAQGRLPEALKRGLANLDEHAVATAGFDRLLVVRTPQAPARATGGGRLAALARWMLSVFKYMLPGSEQPVRAVKVAQLVASALQLAPPGIHIAAPEVVWQAAQGDVAAVAREWLKR